MAISLSPEADRGSNVAGVSQAMTQGSAVVLRALAIPLKPGKRNSANRGGGASGEDMLRNSRAGYAHAAGLLSSLFDTMVLSSYSSE